MITQVQSPRVETRKGNECSLPYTGFLPYGWFRSTLDHVVDSEPTSQNFPIHQDIRRVTEWRGYPTFDRSQNLQNKACGMFHFNQSDTQDSLGLENLKSAVLRYVAGSPLEILPV